MFPVIVTKNNSRTKRKPFFSLFVFFVAIIPTLANDFVFTPINTTSGLSDNQIRYILQLPDGRMVFTTSGNVNIYDGAHFTYIHRTAEHIYSLNQYDGHYRIYQDGDSLLWIKDSFKLFCINLYKGKYRTDLDAYFREKGIDETVEDLFLDDQNRMWLLSSKGLSRVGSTDIFDLSVNQGKLQDLVTEGDLLYLFYNTGEVICYDIKTNKRLYDKSAYPETEQPLFQFTSLVVKGQGGIYQLRNGWKGGFFFFDTKNKAWKKLLEQDYAFNTLIIDSDETAYISCTNGIWRINPRNREKEYIPILKTVKGESISTEISTLFYDRQGGFWLGTFNRGLLYYHPSRYKFKYFGRVSFPGLLEKELVVQAFTEDEVGNMYVKCQSGIYQFYSTSTNGNNLLLTPISSLPKKAANEFHQDYQSKEYQGRTYNALCRDSRDWVWAGSSDGLELFISEKPKQTFYMEDGLSNNFVHAILEDRDNNIWVTTSNGISQIQVDAETSNIHFVNYNQYDGTLENEYVNGAIFESSDGRLFFGGIDGFNVLHPEQLSVSHLPHKPVFSEFRLFGEKIETGKPYNNRVVLEKNTPYTTAIELSYNQNFLTFEFSALNYRNQAQTFYRYQLEGVDADWQEISVGKKSDKIGTDGILQLSYTNLPAGNYRLKVMSADNSPRWDGEVAIVDIVIHAPWWKTTTAYVLYVIFCLLMVGAAIFLYIHSAKKKLERKHNEEILLLRIRGLIEQCSQYEAEQNARLNPEKCSADNDETQSLENNNEPSAEDSLFISRAMQLVEKNLDNTEYSVEQLGRDLCMERTGLYRKLITLLDQSPSLFIRNIRLQRAAQLILENKHSITEIAEIVGFNSLSYFGKCFYEMYGCRPTEYASKTKKNPNTHSK